MCLAVPSKVIELKQFPMAVIEMDGLKKEISIELVPDIKIGEYVIVHVGYALSKMDEELAQQTIEDIRELHK